MFQGIAELYGYFVFRDLKFLLVGGFPLAYVLRKFHLELGLSSIVKNHPGILESHPAMFVAFFLAASYICGHALFHVFVYRIKFWRGKGASVIVMHTEDWFADQRGYEASEVEYNVSSAQIKDEAHRRRLERVVVMKELSACFFVIFVTMTPLVMLLPLDSTAFSPDHRIWFWKMLIPCGVGLLLAIFAVLTNRSRARIQGKLLARLR